MRSYLVTGCSRGIGLELTRQLATSEDDALIFASARSCNNPKFQELLGQHQERIVYVPLDVTDQASIKNAVDTIKSKLDGRGLDVLINNAGVMSNGPIEEMDDLEDAFRINVHGVHNLTRAALPLMRKGTEKKILNISTTLGSISKQSVNRHVATPSYKITKAALNMLTVVYANELEKEGFTVFCVSPGWLKTDLGSENADLPVDVGVTSVLDILHGTGQEGNGRFFNIHVPGWENAPGLNQYDGKEVPW
ncbi:hypothetical protein ASPBRDRAFT_138373 [Aspergillus brasiliensis CBS 101740]|uniref:Ketoreductase domain-containing protein n=1 Tax=Aspergillus brasiliensis (strain CBS 101740 / IMI 381727 / IBT 21946) TaxID=767769 RepID=A0A1L9U3D2_ASPBC|nr:hypothetical protein ASPBRDRAFT_138373 [Aspergillus brasiliensis CBS 101740]